MHVLQCESLKLKSKISVAVESFKKSVPDLKRKKSAQLIPEETRITKFNYAQSTDP